MVGGTRGWVNVLRLTFTTPPNRPQEAPADQSATQGQERLVNVRPLFVAHPQSPKLIQPGEGPFDHPAPSPQSAAIDDACCPAWPVSRIRPRLRPPKTARR